MNKIVLIVSLLLFFPYFTHAANIDMAVSPIKYEISLTQGTPITKTITFYNNSNDSYSIYMSAEDCSADSISGTPKCRAPLGSGIDTQSLATWITFEGEGRFVVPPKGEKKVTFTINPPAGVSPGGHYGAVFLNNLDTSADGGNTVKMIRRAGVLLLVNVPGKLIYKTDIGDIGIDVPLDSAPTLDPKKKNLPKWKQVIDTIMTELDPRLSDTDLVFDETDFTVTFTIPVKNSGNTHILPLGRVELYDEDGMLLKKVGKEAIRSPEGVFLGERIVDYLPINDETSAVLPDSDRVFQVFWKGFAYETIEDGKQVIKYMTPQKYYTEMEAKVSGVLMPWEKYRIRPIKKGVTAKIYLEYRGDEEKIVSYENEEIIYITYLAPVKELNYGAILIILIILFILWTIFAYRKEDGRIEKLEEELEYMETEIDELEKGKLLAKKALAKKAQKKSENSIGDSPKKEEPIKKPVRKSVKKVEESTSVPEKKRPARTTKP